MEFLKTPTKLRVVNGMSASYHPGKLIGIKSVGLAIRPENIGLARFILDDWDGISSCQNLDGWNANRRD